jgi:DNA-binding winged helix-turn-helix (wHTH) protein
MKKTRVTTMAEVVAIRWPEEREKAARLATAGVAVLYIVRGEDDPPIPTGCLEDWVRIPGDDRDFHARLAALELRAALHYTPPFVDDENRLHHEGRILALNPNEARLASALAARFGAEVTDEDLLEAMNDEATTSTNSVRVEAGRLRSRVREVHLAIHRTRHGYILLASQQAEARRFGQRRSRRGG